MDNWFVYDLDGGMALYDDADCARADAEGRMREWRRAAVRDEEWHDDATSVCWGKVLAKAVFVGDDVQLVAAAPGVVYVDNPAHPPPAHELANLRDSLARVEAQRERAEKQVEKLRADAYEAQLQYDMLQTRYEQLQESRQQYDRAGLLSRLKRWLR